MNSFLPNDGKKVKIDPRKGHEGPEGGRGVAILCL
jgi:hypothetical protein